MKMEKFNITKAKTEYIANIKKFMTETGSLFPHISVFGTNKADDKGCIIHIPIPAEYMGSHKQKDEFVNEILPVIIKEVNKKFTTHAVGWAAEAWMRMFDNSGKPDPDNRREVLFITIENSDGENTSVYDIDRVGKQVNETGELVDVIELKENLELNGKGKTKGRFSGIYKKFVEKES